jgi:hypothetical protein
MIFWGIRPKVQDMVKWWQGLQDVQGCCARESYGVYPQAQANIPCHGTLGQKIFYLKPQAQSPFISWPLWDIVAWGPNHGCHGVGTKWLQGTWGLGCGNPSPNTIRGVWNMCTKAVGQKAFLLHTPSHNQIS